ncbi:hypothetical protein BH10ACI2_BH10ACI2_04350 [soil metagenome]
MRPEFAKERPPVWFYICYDAIIQNERVGPWPSILQQPIYWTFRYRLVNELLKESRFASAVKAKAQGVVDLSRI